MIKYNPETPWAIEKNLIYNLRQDGFRKGVPVMINDVAVSVEARHLPPEIQEDIVNTIFVALNRKYWNVQESK